MAKTKVTKPKTKTSATKKTARSRKAKYITIYSNFLMKETKHELIGEPVTTEAGKQQ